MLKKKINPPFIICCNFMSFSLTHASHMDFSIFHYIIFTVIISFKIETSLQELKIKHDCTIIGYRVGSISHAMPYCTVCNSFNLSLYFNLKDINMTRHQSAWHHFHPFLYSFLYTLQLPQITKNSLPFSLPSDLSLGLHGYS